MNVNMWQLKLGNCKELIKDLEDNSIDSIVTDPPYELGFMGKKWDNSGIAYDVELWSECLRVLKHGGHLLAFGGSRTYHRMAVAIEDAGFEIRDQIQWVYGSGFPKSHNISKAIDKMAGDAKQWDGWGTALKPAHEPICVARKPLIGTVAENVLKYGTGGINIDECRVGSDGGCAGAGAGAGARVYSVGLNGPFAKPVAGLGRWPANFIHDGSEEVLAGFPETQSGTFNQSQKKAVNKIYSHFTGYTNPKQYNSNKGSAARFFYCAKASKKDRDEGCYNHHPTVKPTDLMRYLCRLVTPPNGIILDVFTGSGSTGKAAILEGFRFVGFDMQSEYIDIASARIKDAEKKINSKLF